MRAGIRADVHDDPGGTGAPESHPADLLLEVFELTGNNGIISEYDRGETLYFGDRADVLSRRFFVLQVHGYAEGKTDSGNCKIL